MTDSFLTDTPSPDNTIPDPQPARGTGASSLPRPRKKGYTFLEIQLALYEEAALQYLANVLTLIQSVCRWYSSYLCVLTTESPCRDTTTKERNDNFLVFTAVSDFDRSVQSTGREHVYTGMLPTNRKH